MTLEDDFAALAPPSAVRSNPCEPWLTCVCGFVALCIDGCLRGVQAQDRRPHTWTGVWVSCQCRRRHGYVD
jgi:hypothetical protein